MTATSGPAQESMEGTCESAPAPESVRGRLYRLLLDSENPESHQRTLEGWISALIIANLVALLFEHVPAVYEPNRHWFHVFDVFSVIVFTVEYLLRLYLAPEDREFGGRAFPRWHYLRSPFAIIDLLAIAPFYLQAFLTIDLRVLRFLRLLRILKLFRVLLPAWRQFREDNAGRTFRQHVHALVFASPHGGRLHALFDGFIAFWVVVSVLAVILESVQVIHYTLNLHFIVLDAVAVGIFTLEYCFRLYACVEEPRFRKPFSGRFRHATTFGALIDLLAIVPFFLEALLHHLFDLRFLRIFRLMRLLKLTRYTSATSTLTKVVVREWPIMSASAFVMLLLVVLTASLGYLFEHEAQPDKFENIPQAIYWAVITLGSVGYGDITPVTPAGRAMTIVLALMGIGIFAIPAAILSSAFSDELGKQRQVLKDELRAMLADGVISPEERDVLRREAKRLHISPEEVERMVQEAKVERERAQSPATLSLEQVAAQPALAVEHFRGLVGEMQRLALLTDGAAFEVMALRRGRLTESELALWRELMVSAEQRKQ